MLTRLCKCVPLAAVFNRAAAARHQPGAGAMVRSYPLPFAPGGFRAGLLPLPLAIAIERLPATRLAIHLERGGGDGGQGDGAPNRLCHGFAGRKRACLKGQTYPR